MSSLRPSSPRSGARTARLELIACALAVAVPAAGCQRDDGIGPRGRGRAAGEADPAAVIELARFERELGNTGTLSPSSLADLEALHAREPRAVPVTALLQSVYLERGDWGALVRLAQERPEAGRPPAARAYLAKLFIRQGRYREASAILEPLAQADPADPELARLAGHALFFAGEHERAAPLLEAAIANLPGEGAAEPLTFRGLIHLERGETEAAQAALERAVTAAPGFGPALNALGRVRAARGDRVGAEAVLARAAALQESLSADERRRALLAARSQELNRAWRGGDHEECERLIGQMLPLADSALRARLVERLAAVREARARRAPPAREGPRDAAGVGR